MTTDGSAAADRPGDGALPGGEHQEGAHQGPGRWARRGAAGVGMPPGQIGPEGTDEPPTADSGDPDISPSLAGGHAGASHRDQD